MASVTVDITDDGKVGTLPEQLQKFFDERFAEAFGKGKARGVEETKVTGNPVDAERAKALELENSRLKEAEALRTKNFEEAGRLAAERHEKALAEKDAKLSETEKALALRTERVLALTAKDIRLAAVTAGARAESLDELEEILAKRIGLDDRLQPFVRDDQEPGKAKVGADGKPVTIDALVTEYLTAKPHHRAAPAGRGGGASGGRSLAGSAAAVGSDKAAALDAVATNPTLGNVARAFAVAGRKE